MLPRVSFFLLFAALACAQGPLRNFPSLPPGTAGEAPAPPTPPAVPSQVPGVATGVASIAPTETASTAASPAGSTTTAVAPPIAAVTGATAAPVEGDLVGDALCYGGEEIRNQLLPLLERTQERWIENKQRWGAYSFDLFITRQNVSMCPLHINVDDKGNVTQVDESKTLPDGTSCVPPTEQQLFFAQLVNVDMYLSKIIEKTTHVLNVPVNTTTSAYMCWEPERLSDNSLYSYLFYAPDGEQMDTNTTEVYLYNLKPAVPVAPPTTPPHSETGNRRLQWYPVRGAARGAARGAVSGCIWGAVFADECGQGAAYGAAIGAVAGAVRPYPYYRPIVGPTPYRAGSVAVRHVNPIIGPSRTTVRVRGRRGW